MSETSIEERLGHSFGNKSLLTLALTHPSYGFPNNQRLEFLGDAVLQLCVSEKLYRENELAMEGAMTRKRALMVQERSLCVAATHFGVGESLILGKGEQLSGGSLRPSILADAMEALIGAVYLDSGFEQARLFVERALSHTSENDWRDYKTELQEIVQGEGLGMPVYETVSCSGPAHDIRITAQVSVEGRPIGEGTGRNRKEAEQIAARFALEAMKSAF